MKPRLHLALFAAGLLVPGRLLAGSLDPANAPGPTMHTLEEIYQKVSWISPSVVGVTTLTNYITIFSASVAKTGQTNSYASGDDGGFQKGMAWPNPRFTVGDGFESNCVLDNLTGLMWLRNPDAVVRNWTNALVYCGSLDGNDGRGGHGDWRMPNKKEFESLVDCQYFGPVLPNTSGAGQWEEGDPFFGLQSYDSYWSSTAYAAYPGAVWVISLYDGVLINLNMTASRYVWPVRDGQLANYSSSTNSSHGGVVNVSNESKGIIGSTSFAAQCNQTPVVPGSFHLFITAGADGQFTDNASGILTGSFNAGAGMIAATGTISYENGAYGISLGPAGAVIVGKNVAITYSIWR